MRESIYWNLTANKTLIKSIIDYGVINPSRKGLFLGRVRDWDAITENMRQRGYNAKKNALQAQWSKLRKQLYEKCQAFESFEGMSPAEILEAVANAAGFSTQPEEEARALTCGCQTKAHEDMAPGAMPFVHGESHSVMMGGMPKFVDPKCLEMAVSSNFDDISMAYN
ncbi:hypothetical protein F5Y10DRAFT_264923 [Nemania abortiva]|nr:hypothetical protein F5Y10DRAFT_264923 [Nemania abortiva]